MGNIAGKTFIVTGSNKGIGKVISKVLDMPVTPEQKRIMIYKPQLAVIRKILKTTSTHIYCS